MSQRGYLIEQAQESDTHTFSLSMQGAHLVPYVVNDDNAADDYVMCKFEVPGSTLILDIDMMKADIDSIKDPHQKKLLDKIIAESRGRYSLYLMV